MPSSFVRISSNDIIVSASGATGAIVTTASWMIAFLVKGTMRIVRTTSKLLLQIGEGLDVGAH
jgi:hypothetical protein